MKALFDLSAVDFGLLAQMYAQGQKKTATDILRNQTESRGQTLVSKNPTRVDFLDRLYEERISGGQCYCRLTV